jgi:hypothetical protein
MHIASPLIFAIGIALYIYEFKNLNAPIYFGLPAAIIGLACLIGGPILYFAAPGPRLFAENQQQLWIQGCAQSILDQYK